MVELQKEDTKRDESSNLPLARIRIIMKSGDPDFGKISNDAVAMVGRATEMFIKYLTKESHKLVNKKSNLTYDELADMVQKNKKLEFLHQIVPRKLTIREIRRLMAKESDDDSSSDEESNSSSSSDEENKAEVNSISSETASKKDEDDDDDIIEVSSTTTSGSSVVEIVEPEVNTSSKTNKKK